MTDILTVLMKTKHSTVAQSLQTIIPKLIRLSNYQQSMVSLTLFLSIYNTN